jgi:hypothetical protein
MVDPDVEEKLRRYTARDLLSLTPGQRILIYVSQENIDKAEPGDKRNCAFVWACHSAIESCYRAEVAGNHVYVWIDYGDEKWELEFYMTEEVWNLANMFDKNRADVHPATIPIHFHAGKQKNRRSQSSRPVHTRDVQKYKPGPAKVKVESQTITKMGNDPKVSHEPALHGPVSHGPISHGPVSHEPIVKPISVPGQRSAINGPPKSRWDRGQFYTKVS